MTMIRLRPGAVSGTIDPPSSKSYTHRALVLAALTGRQCRVISPLDSEDTRRTAGGLQRLGAKVSTTPGVWTVSGGDVARGELGPTTVDCGESGTTLRLLTCLAALGRRRVVFRGSGRLGRRPIRGLLAVLRQAGAEVSLPPAGRSLPFAIRGPLRPGSFDVPVSETSQFLSGLLIALPFAGGASELRPRGRRVSAPYIRATLAAMSRFGLKATCHHGGYRLPDQVARPPGRFDVPADASAAAALWALAGTGGGTVTVRGLDPWLPQADLAVLGLLDSMGAHVVRRPHAVAVTGPVRAPVTARLDDAPDLLPIVGALASCVDGPSRISGAQHAALKESNRLVGTERLARALGASVRRSGGRLWLTGHRPTRPLRRRGIRDHRMYMAATAAALAAGGPSLLGDADCLAKSYPAFLSDLGRLGVRWETRR